jgi:hypothetical protein
MERGKSKAETGREHLERNDFILAKQKQKLAGAKAKQAQIEADTAAKQEQCVSLDRAIADKEELLKSERKDNAKAKVLSWIGGGDLCKARKEIEAKDCELATFQSKLTAAKQQMATMKADFEEQLAEVKIGYQRKLDTAIARAETAEKKCIAQQETIKRLDRQVNPHRYQLTSGAELSGMRFFNPNPYTYSLKIWTKVGAIEHNAIVYLSDTDIRLKAYRAGDLTDCELVNALFLSEEQVNAEQSRLLESSIELLSGGPAQAHVSTGGGGESGSDSRWDGKTRDDFRPKRR